MFNIVSTVFFDRFIENEVYAYGLLDGYNGTLSVDLAEQCILTDMYFDHLSTLKSIKVKTYYNSLSKLKF